jgi:hypothetical protein
MEHEPKQNKRGRKPKTVKTEEPIIAENVIMEEKQQDILNDEIPEPEPEPLVEEKAMDNFIEELNNEIENPSEEMKTVIEEIFEELKEIITTVEETKISSSEIVEKREEVIEETVETIIEEKIEAVEKLANINNTHDIKSLLNFLIIISIRKDMQKKYGLTTELVKVLQLIIQKNLPFFFKIEDSFKKIVEDNKIDSDDVPELMNLFSETYELLFSLKFKTNTIELSDICGDLIKLAFNIMLTEDLIIFESSTQELTKTTFNALVDSSTSLIKLSKTMKISASKCCIIC